MKMLRQLRKYSMEKVKYFNVLVMAVDSSLYKQYFV